MAAQEYWAAIVLVRKSGGGIFLKKTQWSRLSLLSLLDEAASVARTPGGHTYHQQTQLLQ
jgi:hypothetical protein